MALQTIILRPNGQGGISNASSLTRVPSSTPIENVYMLINEAVADDDATYISSNNVTADIELTFPVEMLSGITPTAVRLLARMKSESIIWRARIRIINNKTTVGDFYAINTALNTWETVSATCPNVDNIKDILKTAEFHFMFGYEGSNKSGKGYLTQLYLEVDYDDEAGGDEPVEVPALYIKKSGAWEPVYGTVYNKVNGAWVEGDLSALSAGDKIIVEEL